MANDDEPKVVSVHYGDGSSERFIIDAAFVKRYDKPRKKTA